LAVFAYVVVLSVTMVALFIGGVLCYAVVIGLGPMGLHSIVWTRSFFFFRLVVRGCVALGFSYLSWGYKVGQTPSFNFGLTPWVCCVGCVALRRSRDGWVL